MTTGAPPSFDAQLAERGAGPLLRRGVATLQLNIGKRCNLACHHCHVESGPKRSEAMDRVGIERIVSLLERNRQIELLDLTGGAPELHPDFRYLVEQARQLGRRVIDRCNLTIFFETGQEDTAEFLASQEVEIAASLPCYSLENVEAQRGRGVFDKSIEALRLLNELGYGQERSSMQLDLVYNPLGPSLPPSQKELEERYRDELWSAFGIRFHRLLTIANMPIKRFAHQLEREGRLEEYMSLLVQNFNPETLPELMCRSLLSVGYDGRLYDCDFNQALEIETASSPRSIFEIADLQELEGQPITTASHCFGCTAGVGSSCGGSLS